MQRGRRYLDSIHHLAYFGLDEWDPAAEEHEGLQTLVVIEQGTSHYVGAANPSDYIEAAVQLLWLAVTDRADNGEDEGFRGAVDSLKSVVREFRAPRTKRDG